MRTIFSLILVTVLSFFSISAQAWNATGHRTVAELAWRNLSKKERAQFTELLKHHPHYDLLLAANVPPGVDTNQWVFLTAAVWPDLIKKNRPGLPARSESITKYDIYPHAIGYPFVREADRDVVSTNNFYIAVPNAEMVLSNSFVVLKNRNASLHDRAVSLCWALHLTGDLHQPLHAATWVRRDKKEWDGLGGNYIVKDPTYSPPKRIHMHAFWDSLPGVNTSYETVAAVANRLEKAKSIHKEIKGQYLTNKTIPSWVNESYHLAVQYAYDEKRVTFAHIDDLKAKKVSEDEIPVLSLDYVKGAQEIVDRRLILAGKRLTDYLKDALKP